MIIGVIRNEEENYLEKKKKKEKKSTRKIEFLIPQPNISSVQYQLFQKKDPYSNISEKHLRIPVIKQWKEETKSCSTIPTNLDLFVHLSGLYVPTRHR